MELKLLILESLYNLNFIDDLYNYIYSKLKDYDKKTYAKINITSYIPKEINKKNYKVYFFHKVSSTNISVSADVETKEIEIEDDVFVERVNYFKINNISPKPIRLFNKQELNDFKYSMAHEVTHILDLIRGNGLSKSYNIEDIEKNKKTQLKYVKYKSELNAFFNTLYLYREKNLYAYNRIRTYKGLLAAVLKKGMSLIERASNKILENENLKKEIIKRLARENILPKSFVEANSVVQSIRD